MSIPTLSCLTHDDQAALSTLSRAASAGLIIYRPSVRGLCLNPHVPYLRATNHDAKIALLYKANCGQWSCPHCADLLKRRWTYRAVYAVSSALAAQQVVSFVTLTPHEKLSVQGSIYIMPRAWDKLRFRLRRAASEAAYMVVPEFHKSGKLHMHGIFIDAPLKRKWWKDNARACGMGYQADMKEVQRVGGVARYVGKYLGKTLQNSNLPHGRKRVFTSQEFPELPELPENAAWTFTALPAKAALSDQIELWQRAGYQVVLTDALHVPVLTGSV